MNLYGPAVASLEFTSIARGYFIMDQVIKKASVRVLEGTFMTPGKFFLLFNGDESSVESSFSKATELSKPDILDQVMIPNVHEKILPGLYGLLKTEVHDALAIVETASMSSGLVAADQSMKDADVELVEIRSSRGIGGKCFYFITGKLEEVEASVDAAKKILTSRGTLIRSEVIARPDPEFLEYFNLTGEA